MAKATILICDWCPTQEPAKGTIKLEPNGLVIDLCKKHIDEIFNRVVKPTKGLAKSAPRKKQEFPPPRQRPNYDEINQKIMELAESRPMFTGADVVRAAKTRGYVTMMAIRNLIKDGKLESTGKGAGRKLSKAS